jgi:hypothetical protein
MATGAAVYLFMVGDPITEPIYMIIPRRCRLPLLDAW